MGSNREDYYTTTLLPRHEREIIKAGKYGIFAGDDAYTEWRRQHASQDFPVVIRINSGSLTLLRNTLPDSIFAMRTIMLIAAENCGHHHSCLWQCKKSPPKKSDRNANGRMDGKTTPEKTVVTRVWKVRKSGTQNEEGVPQNRTSKNAEKSSNDEGLKGTHRYAKCAKRNARKCAVLKS